MNQENQRLGVSSARPSRAPQLDNIGPAHASTAEATSLARLYPRLARYKTFIIAAIAIFLVWEIFTRGLAAYLAEVNPEAALWLRGSQPRALTTLADAKLNPPKVQRENATTDESGDQGDAINDSDSPEAFTNSSAVAPTDLNEIKAWAELALRNDPLNARALRLLGQLAQRSSEETKADRLMQAAAQRSRRESFAIYWTMLKSYREADYAATLRYADILMRTRRQVQPYVVPILAHLAELPAASPQLKQLLAKNPPWRPQFFAYLPQGISDARTPLDLFLAVKDTPTPVTNADLRPYLEFLVQRGFQDLAYYAWLQFLPPEQLSKAGRLFNGNFQTTPSGLPFDWVFSGGNGVTVQIVEREDQSEDNALLIEFGPGRVEFGGVTQLVVLPAGNYQLRGKHKSALVSQRGLQWRILCGSKSLGESAPVLGSDPNWQEFAVSFSVTEDCPLQTIKLALDARSASEAFVSGSIWYDDLSITREPDAEHAIE